MTWRLTAKIYRFLEHLLIVILLSVKSFGVDHAERLGIRSSPTRVRFVPAFPTCLKVIPVQTKEPYLFLDVKYYWGQTN